MEREEAACKGVLGIKNESERKICGYLLARRDEGTMRLIKDEMIKSGSE